MTKGKTSDEMGHEVPEESGNSESKVVLGKPELKTEGKDRTVSAQSETGEGSSGQGRAPVPPRKTKGSRVVSSGVAHIKATFNNTIISIADAHGGVISWCSAGRAGFKGSRKSTAFAATVVAQDAARQAMSRGMHEIEVRVQGAGAGRESAVRGLQSAGLSILMIKDVTPIPHNGCRARKRRRV